MLVRRGSVFVLLVTILLFSCISPILVQASSTNSINLNLDSQNKYILDTFISPKINILETKDPILLSSSPTIPDTSKNSFFVKFLNFFKGKDNLITGFVTQNNETNDSLNLSSEELTFEDETNISNETIYNTSFENATEEIFFENSTQELNQTTSTQPEAEELFIEEKESEPLTSSIEQKNVELTDTKSGEIVIVNFTTSGSWTVPQDVDQILVEAWGAGGSGTGFTGGGVIGYGGGGGGGAYAKSLLNVSSGEEFSISIGAGGTATTAAGNPGGDTIFNSTTVIAKGGSGGGTTIGGNGGSYSLSKGDLIYVGGNGGTSDATWSGGGGGGAGTTGAGGNANIATAGTGTSEFGGNGGTGINSQANGNPGNNYGGGGSGAVKTSNGNSPLSGGSGAQGFLRISYVTQSSIIPPEIEIISPKNNNEDGNGYLIVEFTVNSSSEIITCDVLLDGKINASSQYISEEDVQEIPLIDLPSQNYSLQVSCIDSQGIEGYSNEINLIVSRDVEGTGEVNAETSVKDYKARSIEKESKFVDAKNKVIEFTNISKLTNLRIPRGKYDIDFKTNQLQVESISLKNVTIDQDFNTLFELDENIHGQNKSIIQSFVVNPKVEFDTGEFNFTSKGGELYKCTQWNYTQRICEGTWEKMMYTNPGETYSIKINSSDPAYIIKITKASHLDENKTFISDIYEEVKEQDNIWSEEIPSGDYVRVTFEKELNMSNDITIYPRIVSGTPTIEVYEFNDTNLLAQFTNITSNQNNTIYLKLLENPQDTFDLKVLGGSLEFDHIIDPIATYDSSIGAPHCGDSGESPCIAGSDLLRSRDTLATPEPNQPNTVDTCADGATGTYGTDESIESITIESLNNSFFRPGDTIRVNISMYCYDTSSTHNIVYANNASNPSWSVKYHTACPAAGLQTFSESFVIDDTEGEHVVRAMAQYTGTDTATCGTGAYDDNDDLVFKVASSNELTTTLVSPENNEIDPDGFNFTCSASSSNDLDNLTFYWNYLGTWQSNGTTSVSGTSNSTTFERTNLQNGEFVWNCLACDNTSNCTFASANRTARIGTPAVVVNFTTTGSDTWTVPENVYQIIVEGWGGGGAGAGLTVGTKGLRGGGGAGAYAKQTLEVTPGEIYNLNVGAGAVGTTASPGPSGGDTTFNSTLLIAKGGTGGSGTTGGTGGLASASTGTTKYSGGSGGNSDATWSGGGGGGAGTTGAGGNANIATAGTGTSELGGDGGAGRNTAGAGNPASSTGYGGGGAGAIKTTNGGTANGGSGRQGFLKITYTESSGGTIVTLNSPTDNSLSFGNVNFTCSANSNNELSSITFYWNHSGILIPNGTTSVSGTSNSTTFQREGISVHSLKWNCYACDNESNCEFAPLDFRLKVDDPPTHSTPILNSTFGMNGDDENLTCYNQSTSDPNSDEVKNIFNWIKENKNLYLLNMPFEGGSNSTWTRDYANGRNGTGENLLSTSWGSSFGHDGFGSYKFTRTSNSRIKVPNFSYPENFSISLWFKNPEMSGTLWHYMYSHGDWGQNNSIRIYFAESGNGSLLTQMYANDDLAEMAFQNENYSDNNWHHYALTVSETEGVKLYLDGVLVSQNTTAGKGTITPTTDLYLGGRSDENIERAYNGYIDDVLIFNTTITQEQILLLNASQTNKIHSNLTTLDEEWKCEVTPNDRYFDGTTLTSNNITIGYYPILAFTVTLPGQAPVNSSEDGNQTSIMNFYALTNTISNLNPCVGTSSNCQNSTTPFFIYKNTGNINLDFSIYLNSSLPSVFSLKANTENNSATANLVNTSPLVVGSNIIADQNFSLWFYGDFINAYPTDNTNVSLTTNATNS